MTIPGVTGRDRWPMMQAAFPDMSWTIGRQVAEGDLVATHTWLEGTHLGPFVGIP